MRNFVYIAVAIASMCTFLSVTLYSGSDSREHQQQIEKATRLGASIMYIYDERTDLCFAYLWDGKANSGPALAVVPYERVKDHLLNPPAEPLTESVDRPVQ